MVIATKVVVTDPSHIPHRCRCRGPSGTGGGGGGTPHVLVLSSWQCHVQVLREKASGEVGKGVVGRQWKRS